MFKLFTFIAFVLAIYQILAVKVAELMVSNCANVAGTIISTMCK